MGVLNCAREGCGNVLCDRYNRDFGYICNECFDELVDFVTCDKSEDMMTLIPKFLGTRKEYRPRRPPIRWTLELLFPVG